MWALLLALTVWFGQTAWSSLPSPPKTDTGTTGPQARFAVSPNTAACKIHPPFIGTTLVGLTVDSTGKVKDLSVAFSSGNECVDKSALAAVSRYKFIPGRRDGIPISQKITLTIGVHYQ